MSRDATDNYGDSWTISEILNIRESLIVVRGNPWDTQYTLIFNSCGISLVILDQFLADGDGAPCKVVQGMAAHGLLSESVIEISATALTPPTNLRKSAMKV